MRQDLSWENMSEAQLREECLGNGIALPQDSTSTKLISRLRQALRWEQATIEQLQQVCAKQYCDPAGLTREEMLAFLKSFRPRQPQTAEPKPEPKPPPAARPGGSQGQGGSGPGAGGGAGG